jgi:hypothetical protein
VDVLPILMSLLLPIVLLGLLMASDRLESVARVADRSLAEVHSSTSRLS